MRLFIATALAATCALPALAADRPTGTVKQLQARGCTVQQVHTPAGKMVHNAPIVRCPSATALAQQAKPARAVALPAN
ncbi:hypothetical protein [Sphingomonas endolithica]|uniref:hypothetical protein n=1 Tax=Sphingomonas endolithica TaxID=2972485 RepID=UPI0021AF37AA|nr:hypothetical protein [Sphingomonas sp. ZFBP2030]